MVGKKVIVRADEAGVFFGTLESKDGSEVKLSKCRRLWYWDGANSISQLAVEGTKKPDECKFTVVVENIIILGVIELIECTPEAILNIEGVREWKK